MREWRKIYSTLLESERFSNLSDQAAVLFCLLVIAQDDTGYYPWEPVKVRRLVLSRRWALEDTLGFAEELVSAGMAEWNDGGIVLRKGAELNGRPRDDRQGLLYPRRHTTDIPLTVSDIPPTASDIPVTVSDGHRVDKSRVDKSRTPSEAEGVQGGETISPPPASTLSSKRIQGYKKKPLAKISSVAALLALFSPEEMLHMEGRYQGLDLEWEAGKCVDWHMGKRGGIVNGKLALKNWLDKAKEHRNGTDPGKPNKTDPALAKYTGISIGDQSGISS